MSRCWKLNIFPGLLVWFWSIIDWFFCVKVLKRRLLSPINSQKLNVCIEFVFPAAGENCLLLNIKFLLATCILLTSTLSNELSIQKKSGMMWLSYVTDNPNLCVAILSIRYFSFFHCLSSQLFMCFSFSKTKTIIIFVVFSSMEPYIRGTLWLASPWHPTGQLL